MDAYAMIELNKVAEKINRISEKIDKISSTQNVQNCVWKACPGTTKDVYIAPHIGTNQTFNFKKIRFTFCPFCGNKIYIEN